MVLRSDECRRRYRRREPERGVLHQVLLAHLRTFLAHTRERTDGRGLPGFVVRELTRYLGCGLLAFGFARVRCGDCGRDELVAFSCKGRGFCPSCGARRMADMAAHLVDDVLPHVPIRQWVLSFPFRIRFLLAFDPALCAAVRRIFVRAVLGWYERHAQRDGHARIQGGAVVVAQRFGGALNLNLHFHALVLDGVYSCASPFAKPVFHAAPTIEDGDVEQLTRTLARRITRYLQRRGRLPREGEGEQPDANELEPDEPLFAELCAASVQGRAAVETHGSPAVTRIGRRRERQANFVPGTLCCEVDGFSLHANVLVPDDRREQLEHLCRYVTRPPIATERLSLSADGRVVYRLKRRWRDGTSAVSFDPLTFIERLASLVPRPRVHLLTYHGVLAPAAQWRDDVVPAGRDVGERATLSIHSPSRRATWAELLQRVFAIDVLACPHCGGKRKLIALITEGLVVRKILAHLRLPSEPPTLAPARAPPEPELAFDA